MTTVFHQSVVELSGNKTLTAVVGMLTEIINRHLERTYHETTRPPRGDRGGQPARAAVLREADGVTSTRGTATARRSYWATHMRAIRQYLIPGTDTKVVDLLY